MDAFIAHGLEGFLGPQFTPIAAQSLGTAARYQLTFAIAIMALSIGWRLVPSLSIVLSQSLFSLGTLLFCGSIYLKYLTSFSTLSMVAPVGGVTLMLAFLALLPLCFLL